MKKITFTLLLLFGLLLNNYAIDKQTKAAEIKSGDAFSTELDGTLGLSQVSATVLSIENVVVGSVDANNEDFVATVSLNYDLDSVYLFFNVIDDSIVNTGTSYLVDNIEIYFDMDNSKNVHYPRNAGWSDTDDSFDANDFQIRLVPDVAFKANNDTIKFAGARQVYTKTDDGYSFQLNVEWVSLMPGFAQVSSTAQVSNTLIGFDVLVSDNDAVASDANRNQITYNSSTDKPFNDPSLWGTLKMLEDGTFEVVPDETEPTVPSNVAASSENSTITLSWDASTDDIAVLSYTVSLNDTPQEALAYAKALGSVEHVLRNMEEGTYNIAIKANDNNGNSSDYSDAVSVEVIIIGIKPNNIIFGTYPNPVASLLFINNAATINKVDVIGINGGVMMQKNNDKSELISLDLSTLAKGIYILKMHTNDGSVVTSKLIKE